MSIALQLTVDGLAGVEALLTRLHHPDFDQLLDEIGATVESQTAQRFDDKAGPDGKAWAEWSEKYRKTRHGGQSLLMSGRNYKGEPTQDLHNSITRLVYDSRIEVGSAADYAAHHQFGSKKSSGRGSGVPARPYLGLSDDNRDEIDLIIKGFVGRLLNTG